MAGTPGTEVCDDLDNDCNGSIDDLAACSCQPCTTRSPFSVAAGSTFGMVQRITDSTFPLTLVFHRPGSTFPPGDPYLAAGVALPAG